VICTTGATRVFTRIWPLRSTMFPRGASILILRTRFWRAWDTYSSPVSTCRNHRRKKTIANSTKATPPSTATRTASCGVMAGRRSSMFGGIRFV